VLLGSAPDGRVQAEFNALKDQLKVRGGVVVVVAVKRNVLSTCTWIWHLGTPQGGV
jgi:hypothetical protein